MVKEPEDEVEKRKKKLEEEQKKLDEEQKKKAEETKEVVEDEPMDKIDKANEAAERLERANKKHEELVLRQERIAVNDKLGGQSEITDKPTEADKQKAASKALLPDGMECPGVTD